MVGFIGVDISDCPQGPRGLSPVLLWRESSLVFTEPCRTSGAQKPEPLAWHQRGVVQSSPCQSLVGPISTPTRPARSPLSLLPALCCPTQLPAWSQGGCYRETPHVNR